MSNDLNYRLVLKWAYMWSYGKGNNRERVEKFVKLMLPTYIKAAHAIDKYSNEYDVNTIFVDFLKIQIMRTSLTWTGGSPNTNLIKLTPHGEYMEYTNNPRYGFWKDRDIDPNIIEKFKSFKNNRFPQSETTIELPEKYDLFFLQVPDNKDKRETIDALEYCKAKKVYTLFKGHPTSPPPGNLTSWKNLKEAGHVSEYSIYVEGDTDHLISKANRTYSAQSATGLNAMLQNKIAATYRDNCLSEIVPQIKTAFELDDIEPIKQKDKERFLTWYYHDLCIDVDAEGYEERIKRRIINYKNKVPLKELYT